MSRRTTASKTWRRSPDDERHDRRSDGQQQQGPDGSGRHVNDEEAEGDGEQRSCRGIGPESSAEREPTRCPRGAERMLAHLVSSPPVGEQ